MGSLSSLYISQSYQSLTHLGTNNALSAGTMTQLQDGIGQSLNISFDGTNISSSGNIFAANLTGSQVNTSSLVTTSSFNSYTSSTNARLNSIETTTASLNSSISALNTNSASVNISISNLNSTTASQAISITNLNSFSQSAQASINSLNAATSSYANSASVALVDANQQSQINSLIAATGSYLTASADITALNAFTASQLTINSAIGASTSSLNTFSASTLTRLTNIESTTGSYATTGSNTFNGNQFVKNGALQVASYNETSPQFFGGTVFQGVGTASVAYDQFVNGGNYDALHIESNLNAGTIFQDLQSNTFNLSTWLSIPTNTGNNPSPIMGRGLQVTGSTQVQNFTASLQQGFTYVGNANGKTTTVATSSFATAIPTGTVSSSTQILNYGIFATTGSNLFNGNQLVTNGALQVANYNETSPQFYGPVVFQGVGTASVAYDQFVNAGNFDALHIESNLNAGTIFQDYNGGGLNTWLSIPTNTGSNPAPIMGRGLNVTGGTSNLATTGSNTFRGNQTITGSLIVSNTFTASLANGYTYVGNGSNRTVLVATSSFGGGGSTIDTGSFATTGSNSFVATQTITGSVNITGQYLINGVAISGSNISQFATTGSNTFNGNQNINGILTLSSSANSYFQFTSPNNATGSGAIFFGGLGPYIQTYGDESKQGLQLVAGLSGSFALVTRYAGNVGEIDLHAQYDNSTPGTTYSRIRAFSNGQISMAAEGGAITISGSSTNIQGVNFIPFSASLNSRINAITGSGGTINTGSFATTGSNTFNGSQLVKNGAIQAASYDETNPQFFGATVFQGVGTASVAYDQFVNAGNYDALHIESNLNAGTIFQDLQSNTFNLSTWLSIPTNTGNDPAPIMARGLTIQSGSSFFANGNKQFNVGAFSSLVTQSGSANVSQSMNFATTDISDGVSIASNSRITLANSGTYNIQFSAQVNADTGADTIWIWLKKNGTNISNTSTKLVLANNEANVAAWNFVVDGAAADYFELAWQSSGGHAKLFAEAAAGNYPAIPSIILTVTQVR